ncbi:hypothetical protein [Pseudolactococcus insecticola]|uniref:WxL domain-containing protein n=1 Tax=Pseudolactococcus insecticola TaxID=2709158 RepID=A0A6A0B6U0_9LACT|nr:hypothetical protein [Lactococcus insecticola]GFH40656.1 hypothetical protein Hs20B_10540 [Lactococcus insecticola]
MVNIWTKRLIGMVMMVGFVLSGSSIAHAMTGTTGITITPGIMVTKVSSTSFGSWTTNNLGDYIYNTSAVTIDIFDGRDTGSGDWTLSVRSDPLIGTNGQICNLSDAKVNGARMNITASTDGKTFLPVSPTKNGSYSSVATENSWTPILSVDGTATGNTQYKVALAPHTFGLELCHDLRPADYTLTIHWLVTDGLT